MPNVHHVPILHDVIFAFQAQCAFRSGIGLRSRLEQLIPPNRLRADEMLFQIRVNGSRAILCSCICGNRPRAAFVFPGGEERNQSQQVIALADQARQAAIGQSVAALEIPPRLRRSFPRARLPPCRRSRWLPHSDAPKPRSGCISQPPLRDLCRVACSRRC